MKASEFRGVTVRRGQGECFNVDTLQRRFRCMFGQSYNKIKGCKFIGVYVTNKVNNKQKKQKGVSRETQCTSHLHSFVLYNSRLDNEAP